MTDRGTDRSSTRLVLTGVAIGVLASILVMVAVLALRSGDQDPSTVSADGSAGPSTTAPAGDPADEAEPGAGDEEDEDGVPPAEDPTATEPTRSGEPPAAMPAGSDVSCPDERIHVSSAEELQGALDAAQPGDTIEVADGTHVGKFVISRSGTESEPITICGSAAAVLDGDGIKGGYVLHLQGVAHVQVLGLTVRNGQKGVVADGVTSSVLQGLTVTDIGDEAIHLRAASTGNAVLDNTIRRTGLRREKFGEGVYVGSAQSNWAQHSGGGPDRSDNNLVQGNTISETSSEGIDIKEGTTGGRVIGNTIDGTGMSGADSLIDVKGNEWIIEGNTGTHGPKEGFQTHRILEGWGSRNTFRANTIDVDGDGNHIYVHDASQTDNRILCDNRTSSGDAIRSNVECTP